MNTTKPGTYRVASIPGDHIGNEVIPEAIKALETVAQCVGVSFEFDFFPWGANYYSKNGFVMAPDGLEVLSDYDAILLGAVGDPAKVADHIAIRDLVLKIRKEFDLYVNLRPIRSLPGVAIPIIGVDPFDFVFVRENTEGEYSDIGGWLYKGSENEIALQTSVFTRRSTERIIRHAFGLAARSSTPGQSHLCYKIERLELLYDILGSNLPGGRHGVSRYLNGNLPRGCNGDVPNSAPINFRCNSHKQSFRRHIIR